MEKPRRKRETPEEKLIRLTQIEEELWAHFKKRMHEHISRIKNYIN